MKKFWIYILSMGMLMQHTAAVHAEEFEVETWEAPTAELGEPVEDTSLQFELQPEAANAVTADGLNVEYHSIEDIKAYVDANAPSFMYETFDEVPDYTNAPYNPGKLSQAYMEDGLKAINMIRYIAGLNYDVTLDDTYNQMIQAGQLVNAVNNKMTHTPTQPEGMDYTLYKLGYDGNGSANLAYKFPTLANAVVGGWLNDGDSSNIDRVGHRRWLLNSKMAKTGLGHVKNMTGMYAHDRSGTGGRTSNVWPAQNTPVEFFSSEYPWSISTGIAEIPANVRVKLTNLVTGTAEEFYSGCENGYFNVENGGYGVPGAIIWRPAEPAYAAGDSYKVEITGLKGGDITYTVNFFKLNEGTTALVADPANITIEVGETAVIGSRFEPGITTESKIYVGYSQNAPFSHEWYSTASVIITGTAAGKGAVRFVTDSGLTATCVVTVVEKQEEKPQVSVYGTTLNVMGKIGVRIYLSVPDEIVETAKVHTQVADEPEVVTDVKQLKTRNVGGSLKYIVNVDVYATQMRDDITLSITDESGAPYKLLDKDGNDVTSTGYHYSVSEYCKSQMGSDDPDLANLVAAMDNYGKYAQITFDYNVDEEVLDTDDVSSVTYEDVSDYKLVPTGSVDGLEYTGMTLEINSDTSARVYFTPASGKTIGQFTFTYNNTPLTPTKRGSMYYVAIENIPADELDKLIVLTVSDSTQDMTIEFYALSYAEKALSNPNQTEAVVNVCKALYLYNQAANAFFE